MPKRSEKSVENPAFTQVELPSVLRTRHQWLRWRGVLVAGILGLGATLAALWLVPGSWHAAQHIPWLIELWCGGLIVTVMAIFIAYLSAPSSLLVTAKQLDGKFSAKGRLEAVAMLKDSASPLARAQREEAIRYLAREAQARPVRGLPWLTSCLVMLVLAHLMTLLLWFMPNLTISSPLAPLAKLMTPHPPVTNDSAKPSIVWHTPDPVTEANPLEQVPAQATVTSPSPLQDLTLQVSVNGELKKSIPIPPQQYNQSGPHDIKVTIPLDELKAKPLDVVSYKLTAQDSALDKAPEMESATQFVQVRPFRNPIAQTASSTATAPLNSGPEKLEQLEQAQLRDLSDNSVLAHSDLPADDPVRVKENARVAADQAALSAQAEAAAKTLGDEHAPAQTLDSLRQAEPLMDDSGKKISSAQNEAAQASQEKALNLIASAEQSMNPATAAATPPANPSSDNAFADEPRHELSPREKSLVNQLETLAKNQTALAQEISKNLDDSANKPQIDSPTSAPVTTVPTNPAPTLTTTPPVANATTPPVAAGTPSPAPAANATPPAANATAPPAATGTPPPASTDAVKLADANAQPAPVDPSKVAANANTPPAPAAPPPIVPFSPDANKGNFAERQDRVLKGIAVLQSGDKADLEAVNQSLDSAQNQATNSLHQLSSEQESAAREPSATAAVDLQQTVQAMNQAGETERRQMLAETQQQLNGLANQLRGLAQNHPVDVSQSLMVVATEVHAVQQELQGAADHQENAGSAQGAVQLNQLAQSIQDQKTAPALAAMSKSGLDPGRANAQADKLESLARQAGAEMMPAQPSAQDFAGLADSLEKTQANLAHLADMAGQSSSTSGAPNGTPGSQSGQPSSGQAGSANSPSLAASMIGAQSGQQPGQQPGQPASGQGTPGTPTSQNPSTPSSDSSLSQAYHEAFQNLKNQTQQLAKAVPNGDAAALQDVIVRYDKDTSYRDVKGVDVVRFHTDLQQPLQKVITDVQALRQHAQRDEVVNAPDLDETPAAYRPAVSQYFQEVSRDYHSSSAPNNPKR